MQKQIIICTSPKEKENHLGEVNKAIGLAKIIAATGDYEISFVQVRIRTQLINGLIYLLYKIPCLFKIFYKIFILDKNNIFIPQYNDRLEGSIFISFNGRGEYPAFFLKKLYRGKHIHIGKPKYLCSKQVDHIFTSIHDKNYKRKNVVFCPFFMTDKYALFLKEDKLKITQEYISLFIGGNDGGNFEWKFEDYQIIIDKLILLAQTENKKLFITTSPRTNKEHEELISEKLLSYQGNVSIKWIAYHKSSEEDIYPFLLNSAYCFVTADSETMASDAAAMQKPCITLMPQDYQKSFTYPMVAHLLQINAALAIKPFEINEKILYYPFKKIDFNVMEFFNA